MHKRPLELSRDKFVFEKDKAVYDRMKYRTNILNNLKKEGLKSMVEADDECVRAVLKEESMQAAKKYKEAVDACTS